VGSRDGAGCGKAMVVATAPDPRTGSLPPRGTIVQTVPAVRLLALSLPHVLLQQEYPFGHVQREPSDAIALALCVSLGKVQWVIVNSETKNTSHLRKATVV